jgi:hypothetical protein
MEQYTTVTREVVSVFYYVFVLQRIVTGGGSLIVKGLYFSIVQSYKKDCFPSVLLNSELCFSKSIRLDKINITSFLAETFKILGCELVLQEASVYIEIAKVKHCKTGHEPSKTTNFFIMLPTNKAETIEMMAKG